MRARTRRSRAALGRRSAASALASALTLATVLLACSHREPRPDSTGATDAETEAPTPVQPLLAPAEGWRMGSAAVLDGAVLLLGGEERRPPTTFERRGRIEMVEVEGRLGRLEQGPWRVRRPSRPTGFSVRTAIDRYDPQTGEWSVLTEVPGGRRNAAGAALGGKLYLVGGWPESHSRRLDIYDPAAGEWSQGPPLAKPRNHHRVVAAAGKLWVYGGLAGTNGSCIFEVEVFDPATGQWSEAGSDPAACRYHASAAVHDGAVWLFGGRPDQNRGVAVHDLATGTWRRAGNLPRYLYKSEGAATLGDLIFVVEDGRRELHTLDPRTGLWTGGQQLPDAIPRPGPLVAVGKTVYAIGPGRPDVEALRRPAPGDDDAGVWQCRGVLSQTLPPCVDCRDRSQQRHRWKQLVGERASDRLTAARSVVTRLDAYNAREQRRYGEKLERYQARKEQEAKAPKPPPPDPRLLGGGLGLGKGRDLPPKRPAPGRLHHVVCYVSPGGRGLPAIGKNEGTVSAPRYHEGKLVGW